MTPARITAIVLGTVAVAVVGVVIGDLLVEHPGPGEPPSRTAVDVAEPDAAGAQTPALSVVSLGGQGSASDADGRAGESDGDGAAPTVPFEIGTQTIDVDAFATFDEAAEEGTDPGSLPDLPDGPSVEETDEEAYAPWPGDEGTVEDLADPETPPGGDDRDTPPGTDEDTTADADRDTEDGGAADLPVDRPDGVPPLDPGIYGLGVDLPPVFGFGDPCALGAPAGCPSGIPAVVLGADPTVPLRLGSVGVHGTETFHRNACTSLRSRDMLFEEGSGPPVILAITTNQEAELEVSFAGGAETRAATPEAADVALAQFVGELREDGRVPSEGPGSVVTCVTVPATVVEDGLVRQAANRRPVIAAFSSDDVFDIFNVFMNVDLFEDGSFAIRPTEVGPDDYIDLRAEMNVLAAISACPADTSPTNAGQSNPLGVKIFPA